MNVGMVGQAAGPGVEDGEDAEASADPLWIMSECLDAGCGFAEQDGIDDPLVAPSERPEFRGEGEGEEVVVAGQQTSA
jgi:hypothetical protein